MQVIVFLHNYLLSSSQIGKRLNHHRERARQLYHEAMQKLKAETARPEKAAELPLVFARTADDTMLFATQEEKLGQLKFRPRSTSGNISNSTRMMRREAKNGQFPLF